MGKYEERKLVSKVMEGADGFHLEGGSSVIMKEGEVLEKSRTFHPFVSLKMGSKPKNEKGSKPGPKTKSDIEKNSSLSPEPRITNSY